MLETLLRNCSSVAEVRAIHNQILEQRSSCDRKKIRFVENIVVEMYAKCGSLIDARRAFDAMISRRNVFSWTIIISAYVRSGRGDDAFDLFRRMSQEGDRADAATVTALLGACSSLDRGRTIHALVVELGYGGDQDAMVADALVAMYARCHSLADAVAIFERILQKSVFTWTIMVTAYARLGHPLRAIECYRAMCCEGIAPSAVSFVALVSACSAARDLAMGRCLHARIIAIGLESDVIVGSALVNLYGKCGSLGEARELFDRLPAKNKVTWNAMIASYVQGGDATCALDLFSKMEAHGVIADAMAFSSVVSACSNLEQGQKIHAAAIARELDSDRALCNALVHMYARCGSVADAKRVFLAIPRKNTVSWTTIIAAHSQREDLAGDPALQLFREMDLDGVAPSEITVSYALDACSRMGARGLASGRVLHHAIVGAPQLRSSVEVQNALIDMYAGCGSLIDAEDVFRETPAKNIVSWTNIMAAFVQHGRSSRSLQLAREIDLEGVKLDPIALATILGACAAAPAIALGRDFQQRARDLGLAADATVANALVFMLGSFGRVDDAARVFAELLAAKILPDSNTFTAMIAALARQCRTSESLHLFHDMNLCGVDPKPATFSSVFLACSHAGFLAKALEYFVFVYDFDMRPTAEHFGCIVDLLARSRFVSEAQELVENMPFEPDVVAWRCLLASCADHSRVRKAAREVVQLEPTGCSSHYILLSNLIKCGKS